MAADTSQLIYQIALPLLPDIGLRRSKELIAYFGDAETIFRSSIDDWHESHFTTERIQHILSARTEALRRAEREIAFIQKHNIQTYYFEDEDYPQRLAECPDCPLLLYSKGNLQLNKGKFLSVVGTRMPTDRGKEACRQLVTDLAQLCPDVTIVSGLAYGIDVTAHRAAIQAGLPTIIVPGHGLDRIYPAMHRQTAIDAMQQGGILTEFMSETQPDKPNFVARNRIIAGLSDATVVVESKVKGGSLITADMAWNYNRDIFAFPGRITDVQAAGCNALIRLNRAALIQSAEDLVQSLGWQSQVGRQTSLLDSPTFAVPLEHEQQRIIDILHEHEDGIHVNSLVIEMQLPYAQLTTILFQMEMNGYLKSLPGGIYRALI